MREQLFKAHLAFDPDAPPWRSRIGEWLRENSRTHHFVNAYLTGHPLRPTVVVVLNDRTTAIMLKLALS
jgi:hypothetical protein